MIFRVFRDTVARNVYSGAFGPFFKWTRFQIQFQVWNHNFRHAPSPFDLVPIHDIDILANPEAQAECRVAQLHHPASPHSYVWTWL